MSTILDALRKLQRERERAKPPRDLQESVTQPLSQARPPRRLRSRFVGFSLFALLLLLAGGALIWMRPPARELTSEEALLAQATRVWLARKPVTRPPAARRAKPRRPPAAPSPQPLADAAVAFPSPITPASELAVRPGARVESLAAQPAARVTSAKPAEESTRVEPSASATSPAAAKPTPPPELAAVQKLAKPAAAKSRVSGRRQRDRRRSSKETAAAAAPKPPPAASAVAQRSTGRASTPAPNAPPESTPKAMVKPVPPPAQVSEAERRSLPEPNPFLQPFEPVTRVERVPADARVPDAGEPLRVFTEFPELALESVRWHPDPSRRVANLLVDRGRGITVREGDIVRGALIHRIDPGTVELRVGTAKKLLQMGP